MEQSGACPHQRTWFASMSSFAVHQRFWRVMCKYIGSLSATTFACPHPPVRVLCTCLESCFDRVSRILVQGWLETTAEALKSIDSNHLVTFSSEGFLSSSTPGESQRLMVFVCSHAHIMSLQWPST